MSVLIDLTNQTFGRLTALYIASNMPRVRWATKCECGQECVVRGDHLRAGRVTSCGCLGREVRSANGRRNRTHGHAIHGHETAEYRTWVAMWERCTRSGNISFKYYGGRGIKVCERWLDFTNFLADMGPRPEGKSLDRWPNNDGNYEPGNCRWATPKEQGANKRARVATGD